MSIVGTQSVSLGDLMKLGVPALNAMAQGQQSSIAPSYMVIAALKALTDGQKGVQQPMPQGTIKDQLVAQTSPPAGIAQLQQPMQAPQPFAEGGSVGSFIGRSAGANLLPDRSGYEGMGLLELLSSLGGSVANKARAAAKWMEDADTNMKAAVRGTEPTKSAADSNARVGTEKGRGTNNDPNYSHEPVGVSPPDVALAAPAAPPEPDAGTRSRITASASSRGVGSAGNSPLAKYQTLDPTPSAASFPLAIPRNQQLEDAAAKYASPDDARMAELKAAESRAGLGAFARGMLDTRRGRGFGAVFGPAAADSNDAMEKRADQRREYEDRRADVARELGIKLGEQGRQDFFKKTEYGDSRAAAAAAAELSNKKFANESIARGNEETLKMRQLEIEAAKVSASLAQVAEAAKARGDNKMHALIATISDKREKAVSDAKADIYAKYKDDFRWANKSDPKVVFQIESEAAMAAKAADARYMVMLKPMLREMGVPTE